MKLSLTFRLGLALAVLVLLPIIILGLAVVLTVICTPVLAYYCLFRARQAADGYVEIAPRMNLYRKE